MSQRSGRQQQPFRFWFPYWSTPTPAPRPPAPSMQRTSSRVPASASSRPQTQPQQQPPAAPSPPASPASQPQPAAAAPRRAQKTPSPSPTPPSTASQPQPAAAAAAPPPSPPPRRAQKSPSPPPTPSPSASPSRKSPRLQPTDQRPKPPPSPSRQVSKPPSPSREPPAPKAFPPLAVAVAAAAAATAEETSEPSQMDSVAQSTTPRGAPEAQPTIDERSQLPSAVPPSESTTKPFPLETETPVEEIPLAVSQPEAPTAEQIPTKSVTEPAEEETHPKQRVETEPTPADSTEYVIQKAPTTQTPEPETQAEEIKEEKPKPTLETSEHQKLDEKPEEIPQVRTKPDSELKQDVGTSEQQRLDEKPKSVPEDKTKPELKPKQDTQTSQLTHLDDKPTEITEEKTKPKPEREQETKLRETLTLDETPEEPKDDKPQPKPEIHIKPLSSVTDAQEKKKIETDLSIMVADTEPTRLHPDTSKLTSDTGAGETEKLKEQEKVNGKEQSLCKVNKVSISSGPWASSHDGEQGKFQKEIRYGLSKLVQKLSIGHSGHAGSDQGVSIITLAGKNKGATMFISNEGISLQGHKKQEKAQVGATSDEERSKDTPERDGPIAANVNSNVQSINNSVLNESKCEERNPGVHLVVSTKPIEPVILKEKTEPVKTHKTASGITMPQKLTYEPNIRRRCLRGLLLEPSDDDIEDPQKPRRHGCRFTCDEKKKGKEDNDEGTSKPNSNGRP